MACHYASELVNCYCTVIMVQYSQRDSLINHCERQIALLSDTDTVQSER